MRDQLYGKALDASRSAGTRQNRRNPQELQEMSAPDPAILVAIVALVSTITGATIGAATIYLIARSDRVREDRLHAIKVKRAARLIDAELIRAEAAAEIAIEKRHWWSTEVPDLSTEVWRKYSGTIAADVSDLAWGALIVAMESVDHIISARATAIEAGLLAVHISDEIAATLARMRGDLTRGRDALAPYSYGAPAAPGRAFGWIAIVGVAVIDLLLYLRVWG
ncbi:MAG TPA: hypothetical protein VHR41_19390 [Gemmatimonadales bacterium]|nr:hypothetical protein [Gemmatimonadales bacterium]